MGEVIDLLWKVVSGPTTAAWLEMLVAARTDPELMTRFRTLMRKLDRRVQEIYRTWFGAQADDGGSDTDAGFVFALLNGLALDNHWKSRGEVMPVLAALRALAIEQVTSRNR